MEQIVKLLNERNETQKNLALALKVTPQAINNYIKKKTEPDIKTLIKIADHFGVSLDYLCERQWNNQVGYIPDNKKELVRLLIELDEKNTIKVMGYINGLLDNDK